MPACGRDVGLDGGGARIVEMQAPDPRARLEPRTVAQRERRALVALEPDVQQRTDRREFEPSPVELVDALERRAQGIARPARIDERQRAAGAHRTLRRATLRPSAGAASSSSLLRDAQGAVATTGSRGALLGCPAAAPGSSSHSRTCCASSLVADETPDAVALEKTHVEALLSLQRARDEQRPAAGEHFGDGEPARLADDDVGRDQEALHVFGPAVDPDRRAAARDVLRGTVHGRRRSRNSSLRPAITTT